MWHGGESDAGADIKDKKIARMEHEEQTADYERYNSDDLERDLEHFEDIEAFVQYLKKKVGEADLGWIRTIINKKREGLAKDTLIRWLAEEESRMSLHNSGEDNKS
ncbi:MAG: hypothetical protein UY91_C0042G0006 [Parcubacteria group bacterium GW2011_GWB1_55_9]|nr:MAG: hypothetical protein UY91_C0042G0006 [Parcubacteria group bacterium GW2011_GWB1_55_9]